ncbi:uncharacterized protein L201_002203 [Kwoniella dendrophila CBS 6074]|uniref:DUF1279 domain-containing protein n=1 Tax=Kwoniella dendrophila CBS 6074 TaxID=1295534 RepID=A0AAX4JPL6_9TREE
MIRNTTNRLIRSSIAQSRNNVLLSQYIPTTNQAYYRSIGKYSSSSTPSSSKTTPITSPSPSSSPSPSIKPKSTLIQKYTPYLTQISTRTGVPLPSLLISFLVLHEITAILPVLLIYWIFTSLGLGLSLVNYVLNIGQTDENDQSENQGSNNNYALRKWIRDWYIEGETKIEKVGKRYGIFGYEKIIKSNTNNNQQNYKDIEQMNEKINNELQHIVTTSTTTTTTTTTGTSTGAATKVADAIAAYVVVKALLPLRIAVSIGAAPAFARYTLIPIQNIFKRFRR